MSGPMFQDALLTGDVDVGDGADRRPADPAVAPLSPENIVLSGKKKSPISCHNHGSLHMSSKIL